MTADTAASSTRAPGLLQTDPVRPLLYRGLAAVAAAVAVSAAWLDPQWLSPTPRSRSSRC